ncbi:metal dependent phosphohydrolase [Candidatus Puniceispirillum marinum IMCC1322]|uniref:Metal dependent phosphohydrolase n=1 Tax=Puniceispirillum marinum (strain IMCC1322) TaxID=488538 RepID=D5BTH4_PUNMI|nr:metal dependent phosphohydrolase [Candidatus Puniceispirillum marinum IMCC1322]
MLVDKIYASGRTTCSRLLLTSALMLALSLGVMRSVSASNLLDKWQGVWFSCEFAQRQRAPDDGCKMFDDEGFTFTNGRLKYVRITESDETACRGEKVGQCFRRDRSAIAITSQDRGQLKMNSASFTVRFLGCKQLFYFNDTPDFREIWPDEDRCFWASKRRFYIAPFAGNVDFVD